MTGGWSPGIGVWSQSAVLRPVSGYQRGVPHSIRASSLSLLLVACWAMTGCITGDQTAAKEKKEPAALSEAPLGSRIKRKTTTSPTTSSTREQLEQQRAQQGAIAAGMVNDPAKYSGRR